METYKQCPLCNGTGLGNGRNKPWCTCCGGYGAIPGSCTDYVDDDWNEVDFDDLPREYNEDNSRG